MNRKALFWPLAAMLLTACEKGLVDDVADVAPAGQVTNSVLQFEWICNPLAMSISICNATADADYKPSCRRAT